MGGGATVGAAAPLDAAPGVSACASPWPRDRPREEGRSPRPVLRLRGLRDLRGEGDKGCIGSNRRCPCAGLLHPMQLRLEQGFWYLHSLQHQKYSATCTWCVLRCFVGQFCVGSRAHRPPAAPLPGTERTRSGCGRFQSASSVGGRGAGSGAGRAPGAGPAAELPRIGFGLFFVPPFGRSMICASASVGPSTSSLPAAASAARPVSSVAGCLVSAPSAGPNGSPCASRPPSTRYGRGVMSGSGSP